MSEVPLQAYAYGPIFMCKRCGFDPCVSLIKYQKLD